MGRHLQDETHHIPILGVFVCVSNNVNMAAVVASLRDKENVDEETKLEREREREREMNIVTEVGK